MGFARRMHALRVGFLAVVAGGATWLMVHERMFVIGGLLLAGGVLKARPWLQAMVGGSRSRQGRPRSFSEGVFQVTLPDGWTLEETQHAFHLSLNGPGLSVQVFAPPRPPKDEATALEPLLKRVQETMTVREQGAVGGELAGLPARGFRFTITAGQEAGRVAVLAARAPDGRIVSSLSWCELWGPHRLVRETVAALRLLPATAAPEPGAR